MGSLRIRSVKARICFNSRGEDAVEADVKVEGALGRACSPAGASVGKFEAVAFPPKGAKAAVKLVSGYESKLIGIDTSDPKALSERLRAIDGTGNYSRIGGSTAYAITIAAVEAASKASGVPLYRFLNHEGPYRAPLPLGNVIGGAKHSGPGAPDIQEVLICASGAKNVEEAVRANIAVHREVREELVALDKGFVGAKGDEGGWAAKVSDEDAIRCVCDAVRRVSSELKIEIKVGMDVASSSLWGPREKAYIYARTNLKRAPREHFDYILELAKKYNLFYVEDPVQEEDFSLFSEFTRRMNKAYVTGDDLLVTNRGRLEKAASLGAGNAGILKVNQTGTLYDALLFAEGARERGYSLITSHRSGDTTDGHIAHIAVATGSKMIKCGVLGGERIAKLNELLRIDDEFRIHEGMSMPVAKV